MYYLFKVENKDIKYEYIVRTFLRQLYTLRKSFGRMTTQYVTNCNALSSTNLLHVIDDIVPIACVLLFIMRIMKG